MRIKAFLFLCFLSILVAAQHYQIEDITGLVQIDSIESVGNTLYINADDGFTPGAFYTINNGGPLSLIRQGDYGTAGPSQFFNVNGLIYYAYNDVVVPGHWNVIYNSLWSFNGTPQSCQKLVNELVAEIRPVGNKIFFRKMDNVSGFELWVYPIGGTAYMVKDIYPGADSYSSHPTNVSEYNGKAYFTAYTPASGFELWTSDGTANGTYMVKDINPGGNSAVPFFPMGWNFTYYMQRDRYTFFQYRGEFYFLANDGVHGYELWHSDGTAAGTVMLKDINPSGDAFAHTGGGQAFSPVVTIFQNQLYFTAYDPVHGIELWRSDGTETGTQLFMDINQGSGNCEISEFKEYNGHLYFPASNGSAGIELWRTDGTVNGTIQFTDIMNHPLRVDKSSLPRELTVYDGNLFFIATTAYDREFCDDQPPYDCRPWYLEFSYLYRTDGQVNTLDTVFAFGSRYYSEKHMVTSTSHGLYFKSLGQNQVLYRLLPVDNPPQFISNPPLQGIVGQNYQYDVDAFDPEGDAVSIAATSIPSWLSLTSTGNGTARLSGIPATPGDYTVVLTAYSGNLSVEQTFSIHVRMPNMASLQIIHREEALNEYNYSKPRVKIVNDGPDAVSDLIVEYYFQTENNKVPEVIPYHPNTDNIYIVNVTNGVYKLVFNYIGKTFLPNTVYNTVVGLHYADYSTWNKNNDYSFSGQPQEAINQNICIFSVDGNLLFGTPPDFNSLPYANAGSDINVTDPQGNGELISLNGTGSYDADGTIMSYEWILNGVVIGTTARTSVNLMPGTYTVILRVTDDDGAVSTDTVVVTIVNNNSTITFNFNTTVISAGQPVRYSYYVPQSMAGARIVCYVQRAWDVLRWTDFPNTPGTQSIQNYAWNKWFFGGVGPWTLRFEVNGVVVSTVSISFIY